MPYIKRVDRPQYEPHIQALADALTDQPCGHLNYVITRLCHEWLGEHPGYGGHSEVVATLECVKLELYRTLTAELEDEKRALNPLPSVR